MNRARPSSWRLRWLPWLCVPLAVLSLARQPAAAEQPAYSMGIYPYASPSRLEEIYGPATAELSIALRHPVIFHTASTIEKFYLQLKAQTYDLALLQPLYYVPAVDEFGYLPLIRMREPFKALLVSLESSKVRRPEDLRGKTVATPPAYVPSAILTRRALRERGLVPGKDVVIKEFISVDACMQQVMAGTAAACATGPLGPAVYREKYGIGLRTVMETVSLPNLLFVVHKRVPAGDRKRLRDAMLNWHETPGGQAVLKSINTRGFVLATEADYKPVRRFVRTLDEPWLPSVP